MGSCCLFPSIRKTPVSADTGAVMDVTTLTALSKWMEDTDLDEVTWRHGKDSISLKTGNIQSESCVPVSRLQPVLSPSVGIFRSSIPGHTSNLQEGSKTDKGAELGWIETGKNRESVQSPCAGILKIIAIKDGQAAEYGQPLFFVETE